MHHAFHVMSLRMCLQAQDTVVQQLAPGGRCTPFRLLAYSELQAQCKMAASSASTDVHMNTAGEPAIPAGEPRVDRVDLGIESDHDPKYNVLPGCTRYTFI